jgi:hypothetical protein
MQLARHLANTWMSASAVSRRMSLNTDTRDVGVGGVWCDCAGWIYPPKNSVQLWIFMNTSMNLWTSYKTRNFLNLYEYSVFLGFWSLSIWTTLKSTTFRKLHLFPPSDEGVGDTYSVRSVKSLDWLALSNGPNRVFLPHLRTETDPVYETLCYLVFFIVSEDG